MYIIRLILYTILENQYRLSKLLKYYNLNNVFKIPFIEFELI